VARGDVAANADYREVFHFCLASGLWLLASSRFN